MLMVVVPSAEHQECTATVAPRVRIQAEKNNRVMQFPMKSDDRDGYLLPVVVVDWVQPHSVPVAAGSVANLKRGMGTGSSVLRRLDPSVHGA